VLGSGEVGQRELMPVPFSSSLARFPTGAQPMMEIGTGRMSMLNRRFLVRPSNSFLSTLDGSTSDLATVLRENLLWTHTLGQRTRTSKEESVRFIKLLHVCSLISHYGNDADLPELTGPPEPWIEYFDAHWDIYHVDCEMSADDELASLLKEPQEQMIQVLSTL
jgi:hypothetical protein